MIIQCKSCTRKYIVVDNAIPKNGRTVQCGYCSVTWHQMPPIKPLTSVKKKKFFKQPLIKEQNISLDNVKASDGKTYKFLGRQWAEVLPSGKTGLFARKIISKELNQIAGREEKNKKIGEVNPSSGGLGYESTLPDKYKPRKSMGFFSYTFLIIIIGVSIIGALKFFEDDVLIYYPEIGYLYTMLDQQLEYIAETSKNLFVLIDDLINSY